MPLYEYDYFRAEAKGGRPSPTDRERPRATIYGAGIAGLTVAHELAERGFKVRVVEADTGLDGRGSPRMAIGGVARTQYAAATRLGDDAGWRGAWCSSEIGPAQTSLDPFLRQDIIVRVDFEPGSDRIANSLVGHPVTGAPFSVHIQRSLERLLSMLPPIREVLITGYAIHGEGPIPPGEIDPAKLASKRAAVTKALFERILLSAPSASLSPPPTIRCATETSADMLPPSDDIGLGSRAVLRAELKEPDPIDVVFDASDDRPTNVESLRAWIALLAPAQRLVGEIALVAYTDHP